MDKEFISKSHFNSVTFLLKHLLSPISIGKGRLDRFKSATEHAIQLGVRPTLVLISYRIVLSSNLRY